MDYHVVYLVDLMIKTIFWDFDGVILDSMKIKGDGFKELFKRYGAEKVSQLEKYHYDNGGVSRFDKIKYFYNDILNESISDDMMNKEAKEFATIVGKKLFDKSNLIEDSITFIRANYIRYDFHIVSGAEHHELNQLIQFFDLTKYFITVNGSPTKKSLLVQNILHRYKYDVNESILIGDANTDKIAAKNNGIRFYGYNNLDLKTDNYIQTFNEVDFEQ